MDAFTCGFMLDSRERACQHDRRELASLIEILICRSWRHTRVRVFLHYQTAQETCSSAALDGCGGRHMGRRLLRGQSSWLAPV